jgi:divalent metal cation (Fe/Co/Zn/Cd) transporter
MPGLALYQRRLGERMRSASVVADSRQTLICAALSGVLLFGLVTNSAFGWSWADPVAALVIAGVALEEGLGAWRGDACCATGLLPTAEAPAACEDPCGSTSSEHEVVR